MREHVDHAGDAQRFAGVDARDPALGDGRRDDRRLADSGEAWPAIVGTRPAVSSLLAGRRLARAVDAATVADGADSRLRGMLA